MHTFLDRLTRLLAMTCWHPTHYHFLWAVYPAVAEDDDAPARALGPAPVSEPTLGLPRMRAHGE